LETIEEIGVENKHLFLEAGGKSYHYIPALNAGEEHIEMLGDLVGRYIG
jgi:ferrochelatase